MDEEVLAAAAAMSMVRLDEKALALGAALERLGAMAFLRRRALAGCALAECVPAVRAARGKKMCGKKERLETKWRVRILGSYPWHFIGRVKTLESYSLIPRKAVDKDGSIAEFRG